MNEKVFNFDDLASAIQETAGEGAALVRDLIRPDFLSPLVDEVESGPFERAEEGTLNVIQKFDRYAFLHMPVGMPFLRQLQLATAELVQGNGKHYPQLFSWNAIDIVIQRYGPDGILTGHKDLARHPYIIASFTLTGSCRFEVLETRDGRVTKSIQPKPGDLVLLRAPGLASPFGVDDRPFHRVSGALDSRVPRTSVTFRDNLSPGRTIHGFTYLNA